MRSALIKFALVVAAWTLLATFLATSTALYRFNAGSPVHFFYTLRICALDYWIWAALTPVIFFLARRFPFRRESWPLTTVIHFGFYLLLTLAHETMAQLFGLPASAPPAFHGSILWLRFITSLYNDLWMYWPAVLVWSLLHYYQRYRERDMRAAQLKEQLTRAELQALRNQLHPHFLFNALNSVASLMHEDVRADDDMLADLGQLLRAYLSGNDEHEIALRSELALLETYIRIQQRRFEDHLQWLRDVPGELMDAAIPALLLQPLVENSIIHGIAPLASPGQVKLTARVCGAALNLEVADSGVGLPELYSEGIGLANARSRLRQLYGNRCSFEMTRGTNGGVLVKIAIPLRFLSPQVAPHLDDDTNPGSGRRTAGAPADPVVAQDR